MDKMLSKYYFQFGFFIFCEIGVHLKSPNLTRQYTLGKMYANPSILVYTKFTGVFFEVT